MPSIDLSKYKPAKPAPLAKSADGESGFLAFMNKDINFGSKELSDKKKEGFYLELAALLRAGIDLKNSLELVTGEQKKEKEARAFKTLQATFERGLPFSEAMKQSGKFSAYEVFSVQIGEETGKLTEVLQDLARYYQHKIKQRRKIVAALTYPCIVMCTSLSAVFIMLKYVVPMFGDIFKRFGGHLPWITQKIIAASNILQVFSGPLMLVLLVIGGTLYRFREQETLRRVGSMILLKIPLVGELAQKIYLARFCNSMRLLINARLPLVRTLGLVKQMIRFYPIEVSLRTAENDIPKGKSLSESFQQFDIYPSKMVQLVKVGEETGKLDYFFGIISDQYLEEVEYKTSTLSSMMEPLIIVFMGLVVGVILVSMYLPMFQMSNSFQ